MDSTGYWFGNQLQMAITLIYKGRVAKGHEPVLLVLSSWRAARCTREEFRWKLRGAEDARSPQIFRKFEWNLRGHPFEDSPFDTVTMDHTECVRNSCGTFSYGEQRKTRGEISAAKIFLPCAPNYWTLGILPGPAEVAMIPQDFLSAKIPPVLTLPVTIARFSNLSIINNEHKVASQTSYEVIKEFAAKKAHKMKF
uniref:Uncharacterized protein n=1 Tax=Timema douglasi TaxID=61478 RepID=A0A7R8VN99_TIMDO|nr:unnamed protein product [Timema douglasi]